MYVCAICHWAKLVKSKVCHGVPLGTGGMYQSDRRLVWAVYRYAPMYRMSIYSVWLSTVWYVLYRQLVDTPV